MVLQHHFVKNTILRPSEEWRIWYCKIRTTPKSQATPVGNQPGERGQTSSPERRGYRQNAFAGTA